jgi:shikimate kinase
MKKKPRIIYVIGFMGCGKSTAGKKLASVLGWNFMDLDELIEKNYSQSIEEIFMLSGENAFRKYESAILHDLIIGSDTVIAVGGGTPCFSKNLEFMKMTGKVVYLKLTPVMLRNRISADKKPRPLLKGLKEEELKKFIELRLIEREPYYLQAGLVVDGTDPDIELLAEKAMQMFTGRRE